MIYLSSTRMALGVFLLFLALCNSVLGNAGLALCLHNHGGIHIVEEAHEATPEHCLDDVSIKAETHTHSHVLGEACDGAHQNDAHCIDLDLDLEFEDMLQSSEPRKAAPSMNAVAVIAFICDFASKSAPKVDQGEFKLVRDLFVKSSPLFCTETTLFRL